MQTWTLRAEGRDHRVTADPKVSRTVTWYVDGERVAEQKSADEKVRLVTEDHGALEIRPSMLGAARRATWHPPESDGRISPALLGGVDLEPEPGSTAAAYEQKLRDHPRRHAAFATAGGIGKVVVPIVLVALLARLAFSLDLPFSLPSLPDLPDLPDIPWPDLPNLPWPAIDLPELPGWVQELLDVLTLVVPVVIAFVLARAEIRRRRHQDALREQRRGDDTADDADADDPDAA